MSSGSASFGRRAGISGDAWFVPLLLKYSPLKRKRSPFVTAGATLRHLGPLEGQGVQIDFFLRPNPQTFSDSSLRDLDVADTVGAGMRWRAGFVDITPEIRFLHWTSLHYQPVQNQAMLLLGIAFPARR